MAENMPYWVSWKRSNIGIKSLGNTIWQGCFAGPRSTWNKNQSLLMTSNFLTAWDNGSILNLFGSLRLLFGLNIDFKEAIPIHHYRLNLVHIVTLENICHHPVVDIRPLNYHFYNLFINEVYLFCLLHVSKLFLILYNHLWSVNVFLVIIEIQLLLESTYGVFFFHSVLQVVRDELFEETSGSASSSNNLDAMYLLSYRASNEDFLIWETWLDKWTRLVLLCCHHLYIALCGLPNHSSYRKTLCGRSSSLKYIWRELRQFGGHINILERLKLRCWINSSVFRESAF